MLDLIALILVPSGNSRSRNLDKQNEGKSSSRFLMVGEYVNAVLLLY